MVCEGDNSTDPHSIGDKSGRTVETGFEHVPNLIHFFGPDGSGKSTHADLLVGFLLRQGVPARKFWLRSPHTFAFVLWRLLVRLGFYRTVMNSLGVAVKLPAVNRRGLRSLWCLVEFLSVIPIIVRANYLMKRGYKLVAERYIFDTITTIAYFIDDIDLLNSTVSNLLIRFIPRNTVFLFLDSDYETIFQRRAPLFGDKRYDENKKIYGAVPKSAVEPRDFIDFQRRAYHALAASSEALIVYTPEFSIEETHSIILDYLHLR